MEKKSYVIITEGSESERPAAPFDGYQFWNNEIERLEVYKNNSWKKVFSTPCGEVIEGDSFTYVVEGNTKVLMGGIDITATNIIDGLLTINEVYGDIIFQDAVPTPEPPAEGDGGENTEGGE